MPALTPELQTALSGLAWCVGFLMMFNLHRFRK